MARLKLTASVVDKAQPKEREYCIPDSEQKGFILRVRPSGEKTFCLLYRNAASQRKRYTIGSADKYTLVQARAVAAQQLGKVALGADVQEEKQEARKDLTLDQFLTEHYSPWLCEHLRTGEAIERKIRMAFKGLLNTKLSAISAFHVEKIRTEYTKAGKRTAANRYAEMIKALMARAHKWGFIEVNAIAGKVSRHREDPGRVRYLDAAEEARLLEALDRPRSKAAGRAGSHDYMGKAEALSHIARLERTGLHGLSEAPYLGRALFRHAPGRSIQPVMDRHQFRPEHHHHTPRIR